ncbi:hypothetical protein AHF37_08032 [Paragonimus kellicotti]|nr:hypothetical protein AHF37_08032 [Paragonimus kellicotti]
MSWSFWTYWVVVVVACIGTVLRIKNFEPLPDGRLLIDTRGCARVRVLSARVADGCVYIRFEFYSDLVVNPDAIEGKLAVLHEELQMNVVGSCL